VSTEVMALPWFRFWRETRGSTMIRAPVHCHGEASILPPMNQAFFSPDCLS
jgi:hypothetical protein